MTREEIAVFITGHDEVSRVLQTVDQNVQETTSGILGMNQTLDASGTASGAAMGALGRFASTTAAFVVAEALSELPQTLMNAARAANEDAASITQLRQALANSGMEDYAQQLEDVAEASASFGIHDEDARKALALLVAQTGDAEDAMRRYQIALDLSYGANIKFGEAARLVGQINENNSEGLARFGVVLDNTASEEEKLLAIQERFAGQADAFKDSGYAASWNEVNDAVDDAEEALGQLVAGPLAILARLLAEVLQFLAMFATGFSAAFNSIVDTASNAIDSIESGWRGMVNGLIDGVNDLIEAWNSIPFMSNIDTLDRLGEKEREVAAVTETVITAADEYAAANRRSANSAEVLNNMLEKQINNLGLTRMGFEGSVNGINAHIAAIDATTAAYEGLSQAELNYIIGTTSPFGSSSGGGIPSFPTRAGGGPVAAGEIYHVSDTEFFRSNTSGEIIPLSAMSPSQGGGEASNVPVVIEINLDGMRSFILRTTFDEMARGGFRGAINLN